MGDEATGLMGVWLLRSAHLERVDDGEKIFQYGDASLSLSSDAGHCNALSVSEVRHAPVRPNGSIASKNWTRTWLQPKRRSRI
jgi:hypothetical protein